MTTIYLRNPTPPDPEHACSIPTDRARCIDCFYGSTRVSHSFVSDPRHFGNWKGRWRLFTNSWKTYKLSFKSMGYDEKDLFSPRVYFLVKIPSVSKFFPGRACIIGIQIIATATASLKSPTRRGVYTFLSLIFFFFRVQIYIYTIVYRAMWFRKSALSRIIGISRL